MPKALIMGSLYQPLVTSDLPDPHKWYSNDLGLGWPQVTSSDLGISKCSYGLENGLMETGA